jgi:tRNA(Ile)-lysidine synthase
MNSLPARPADRVETKVLDFIRAQRLFEPGQSVVLAVSGGADSLCLLHVLLGLRERLDIRLHVAHLDHMLRGSESSLDARFVSSHARSLGLDCTVEARDVQAYRLGRRCSLEEAAREVRYTFLAGVARETGAAVIATGHTRDDSVETVMLHVLRGAGVHGLRGLDPVSPLHALPAAGVDRGAAPRLVRPLLPLSREETQEYCLASGLPARSDSSNESLSPLRNRVRLELLPYFRSLNPRFDDAVLRLSTAARDDDEHLSEVARTLWAELASVSAEGVSIDLRGFAGATRALQARLVCQAVEHLNGSARDVGFDHLAAVRDLVSKPVGKSVDMPGCVAWRREESSLVAFRTDMVIEAPREGAPAEPVRILVPGETSIPCWHVTARLVEGAVDAGPGAFVAQFDVDRLGTCLFVRRRRPGDRFRPLGMSGEKKLQDFMVDSRIPAAHRDEVPIVCSESQIAWVVGWRIDDRVKVSPDTRAVLRLEFSPE